MEDRPEVLINRYVRNLTATINITTGVGTLALLWSSVVLLGGFVSTLGMTDFCVLTAFSFLMAFRVAENYEEFKRGIYWEEVKIIAFIRRQEWLEKWMAVMQTSILCLVLIPKYVLFFCVQLYSMNLTPYMTCAISVWRVLQRDYGDADDDVTNAAKLSTSLDIFYALVFLQSVLVVYWRLLDTLLKMAVVHVGLVTWMQCRHEIWTAKLVDMYHSETRRKFRKDGELPDKWNLISYGLELLQSACGHDDHLWGARILDQLFAKDKTVKKGLLSSRLCIHNLIDMIGQRGTADDIEKRERSAGIIAHLATGHQITHFPGLLQCISSLLDPGYTTVHVLDRGKQVSDTAVLIATGQTLLRSTSFPESYVRYRQLRRNFGQEVMSYSETNYRHLYESTGAKQLLSQGLLILEKLTQDQGNCAEICKDQRLLSIITAPLSYDVMSNLSDTTVIQMLNKVLTVLIRLLTTPGYDAARLCHEMASNKEVVSSLMGIVDSDREGAQELHGEALEILTELAFDNSLSKQEFSKLLKILLCSFLQKVKIEQADKEIDKDRITRLMGTGKALARLLPSRDARDVLSEEEAVNLSTMILDQILSSEMGRTQENKDHPSKDTEFIAAILSLTLVMCNRNGSSKEYFARPTAKDTVLAKKLKEILDANNRRSVECLRVVKLICQVVIDIIKVKPSCTRHFNEHKFRAALTKALETMSEVDYCMLFAGNDREVIKPARSLASLVSEAQEFLQNSAPFGS